MKRVTADESLAALASVRAARAARRARSRNPELPLHQFARGIGNYSGRSYSEAQRIRREREKRS